MLMRIYGVKNYKTIDEALILKQSKKYKIPESSMYYVDSAYFGYFKNLDSVHNQVAKDRMQPLQACYYDASGQLVSFQINCYAGGFPNLKWNRGGIFSSFIPKQQAPLDTLLNLQEHTEFLRPINEKTQISDGHFDYVIMVHWTVLLGRQSKRLIRYVQRNAVLGENFKIDIRYVNMEMLWEE
jgi:hypothetical protein